MFIHLTQQARKKHRDTEQCKIESAGNKRHLKSEKESKCPTFEISYIRMLQQLSGCSPQKGEGFCSLVWSFRTLTEVSVSTLHSFAKSQVTAFHLQQQRNLFSRSCLKIQQLNRITKKWMKTWNSDCVLLSETLSMLLTLISSSRPAWLCTF